MSKIRKPLLAVALAVAAAPVLAANPSKVTILHCGCTYDALNGPSMVFVPVEVNRKARGHAEHGYGSVESCYAGTTEVAEGVFEDRYTDFVRMADDCQLAGSMSLREPIMRCEWLDEDMPQPGDPCGEEPWY